jgi:hypothetical protein
LTTPQERMCRSRQTPQRFDDMKAHGAWMFCSGHSESSGAIAQGAGSRSDTDALLSLRLGEKRACIGRTISLLEPLCSWTLALTPRDRSRSPCHSAPALPSRSKCPIVQRTRRCK